MPREDYRQYVRLGKEICELNVKIQNQCHKLGKVFLESSLVYHCNATTFSTTHHLDNSLVKKLKYMIICKTCSNEMWLDSQSCIIAWVI